MKKLKFLLIAVATLGLTSFFACGGGQNDEATDSTSIEQASDEPTIEETPDSTATLDTISK